MRVLEKARAGDLETNTLGNDSQDTAHALAATDSGRGLCGESTLHGTRRLPVLRRVANGVVNLETACPVFWDRVPQ
jgi:hypothetical protein